MVPGRSEDGPPYGPNAARKQPDFGNLRDRINLPASVSRPIAAQGAFYVTTRKASRSPVRVIQGIAAQCRDRVTRGERCALRGRPLRARANSRATVAT